MSNCKCGKTGYFGFSGQPRGTPRYCSKCKLPGMKNISGKKCEHPDCNLFPAYGFKRKSVTRCKTHKLSRMINKAAGKCKKCSKFASYNYKDQKTRIYCVAHKLGGMINLNRRRKKERKNAREMAREEWSKQLDQILDMTQGINVIF
jgi:hypothetical protein